VAEALMRGTRVSGTRTITERWRVQREGFYAEDGEDVIRINTVPPYFISISYVVPLYGTDPSAMEFLGAQKPKYPAVISSEVNVVYAGQQFENVENELVDAIVDIANRQACSDAFKKFGLTIPYDIVKSGKLKVAGSAVLYQSNATQLLGWTEAQVAQAKATFEKEDKWLFPSYTADFSYPGVSTVVFNPRQVKAARFGSLKDVVIHAFIHLGGEKGDKNASPHDLANFKGYDEILKACR